MPAISFGNNHVEKLSLIVANTFNVDVIETGLLLENVEALPASLSIATDRNQNIIMITSLQDTQNRLRIAGLVTKLRSAFW